MDKYETPQQFVNENKDKLFLEGFEVVRLDSFIESEYDQEPCYKVIKFIGCPPRFYYEEVPIIMGLTPLEKLPDYKDIVHNWDINFECVGEILNSKKTSKEITDKDIKAIMLIHFAMTISTPRMRMANLEFVLSRPKYGLKVTES